jgi:hypothetical protein
MIQCDFPECEAEADCMLILHTPAGIYPTGVYPAGVCPAGYSASSNRQITRAIARHTESWLPHEIIFVRCVAHENPILPGTPLTKALTSIPFHLSKLTLAMGMKIYGTQLAKEVHDT